MSEQSRDFEALFYTRVALAKQKRVAEVIGVSETTMGRIMSGEQGLRVDQIGPAFAAIGMRVVTEDEVIISSIELDAIRRLASLYLALPNPAQDRAK